MSFAGSIKAHVQKAAEQKSEETLRKAQKVASNIAAINVKLAEISVESSVVVRQKNREASVAVISNAIEIINKIALGQLEATIEGNYSNYMDLPLGERNMVTIGIRHIVTGRGLAHYWGIDTSGLETAVPIDEETITNEILSDLKAIF